MVESHSNLLLAAVVFVFAPSVRALILAAWCRCEFGRWPWDMDGGGE